MENNLIDYTKISDNEEVISLIKKREEIEKQIRKIDEMALGKYEMEVYWYYNNTHDRI